MKYNNSVTLEIIFSSTCRWVYALSPTKIKGALAPVGIRHLKKFTCEHTACNRVYPENSLVPFRGIVDVQRHQLV